MSKVKRAIPSSKRDLKGKNRSKWNDKFQARKKATLPWMVVSAPKQERKQREIQKQQVRKWKKKIEKQELRGFSPSTLASLASLL